MNDSSPIVPANTCSPQHFRDALSQHVIGIAVATVRDGDRPVGLTLSSLTSYSSLPPSVCMNVSDDARSRRPIIAASTMGVHLLAEDQWALAELFSSRLDDKFAHCHWHWHESLPRLEGVLAFLACRPAAAFHHGDHSVLVAEVRQADILGGRPLAYFRRSAEWRLMPAVTQEADPKTPRLDNLHPELANGMHDRQPHG